MNNNIASKYHHNLPGLPTATLKLLSVFIASAASCNLSAQEARTTPSDINALEEVVVTGTLIRGIEPIGSQSISLDEESIALTGASSANGVLGSLPQATNFFNDRSELAPEGSATITVNRPNLRNLPGGSTATGAFSLVLVDGHRIVPVGVRQSAPDADTIAPAIIERVEVITDGGSSLYGADAVGGVINFVTKSEFDGVQLDLNHSIGDGFDTTDASLTAGKRWDSGSAFISYSQTERGGLQNKDRDWAAGGTWNEQGQREPNGVECVAPVGSVQTWAWVGSAWTNNPGAAFLGVNTSAIGEPCDDEQSRTLQPEDSRQSVFVSFKQDINSETEFSVKAFFSDRTSEFKDYPLGATVQSPSPNDLGLVGTVFDPANGLASTYDQNNASFSFGAHPNYGQRNLENSYETWGITPELVINTDFGWQLRTTLHYSKSDTRNQDPDVNQVALNNYVQQGQLAPFDIASLSSQALNDILNWETGGETVQELTFMRMIADGAVATLPAGEIRMAAGFDFSHELARQQFGSYQRGDINSVDGNETSRNVKAAFAEVHVPILENLDASFSVRHDDYSDFGDTTNPHVGLSFQPFEWLELHANWGESFNPPTLIDNLGRYSGTFGFTPNAARAITAPASAGLDVTATPDLVIVRGASDQLDPQTAETWAAGFTISPTQLSGLRISANYYEIDFQNILGLFDPRAVDSVTNFPERFIFNPTVADLEEYAGYTFDGEDILLNVDPSRIGIIVDFRTNNTLESTVSGVDFAINYEHGAGSGTMTYGLSGNYQLDSETVTGSAVTDEIEFDTPVLKALASVGWANDSLSAGLNIKYSDGFDIEVAAADSSGQTSVDEFITADIYTSYRFDGEGLSDGLSLFLRINNILDEEPPLWRKEQAPYSGFTQGRLMQLGLSKRF